MPFALSEIDNARFSPQLFVSGKPTELMDELSPDWLLTQILGHRKTNPHNIVPCEERYALKRANEQHFTPEIDSPLDMDSELVHEATGNEVQTELIGV